MEILRLPATATIACSTAKPYRPPPTTSTASVRRLDCNANAVRRFITGFVTSPLQVVSSAMALDYDEIVRSSASQPVAAPEELSLPLPEVDVDGFVNQALAFISENPVAVVGGALAIFFPLALSRVLSSSKSQSWGSISAASAFQQLATTDNEFQLLDVREGDDIKAEGTPDLRKYRKRIIQVAFSSNDDPNTFTEKVKKKFKDPSNTTLYILDRFDGNSSALAKLLATNGFKAAYAIKDGADGQRGWQRSELPWILPRKGFTLNLDALKDVIQLDNDAVVPAALGVAAAAGVGFVVFSEAETALQLVGTAALLQLFVKKFLFAEDRKKTVKEIQTFLDTKIAPNELVDEVKGVGKSLLPKFAESNGALVTEKESREESKESFEESSKPATPLSPYTQYPEMKPPTSVQAVTPEESSGKPVTVAEEEKTVSRPLSPYTQFPDLKPPSSPTPSKP